MTMPDTGPIDILLTGASGLVGQGVLHELLQSPDVGRITCLVRRPLEAAVTLDTSRLRTVLLPDFADAARMSDALAGHAALLYCAGAPPLGTPHAEYRRVTVDLTLAVARAYAAANPHGRIAYVSGAGADPASRLMPMRIKGEAEQALQRLPVTSVVVRPGGIAPVHGERSPHAMLRALYAVGAVPMQIAARLAPAMLTTTAQLGRAMIALARTPSPPAVVENAHVAEWAEVAATARR